jgi:hypothetical protein
VYFEVEDIIYMLFCFIDDAVPIPATFLESDKQTVEMFNPRHIEVPKTVNRSQRP